MAIIDTGTLPFSITRLFYIYDVVKGQQRGGHAHRRTEQFVLATRGSFKMDLTDGIGTREFLLNHPSRGVYIPVMIWDRLYDFSSDAVCMVLASTSYDESDYIRDWTVFANLRGAR